MTSSIAAARTLAPPEILTKIEADAEAAVGNAFVALAADYFAQTRSREGRVSTAHTPAGLAARFAEPAPRAGNSVESIIARLRSDVLPDCNRLYHPRYAGHQLAGPLPAAVWMGSGELSQGRKRDRADAYQALANFPAVQGKA